MSWINLFLEQGSKLPDHLLRRRQGDNYASNSAPDAVLCRSCHHVEGTEEYKDTSDRADDVERKNRKPIRVAIVVLEHGANPIEQCAYCGYADRRYTLLNLSHFDSRSPSMKPTIPPISAPTGLLVANPTSPAPARAATSLLFVWDCC